MKLTNKQQRFTAEYLIDNNASRAAMAAGYSSKTAESQGSRLLRNVKVARALDKALAKQAARTEITADRVLKEYAKIGFADVADYLDTDCQPKEITALSRDQTAAIRQIELYPDGGGKIQLHDKMKALDSLSKHLGLYQHDSDGRDLEPPSLKVFIQNGDGKIHSVGGELPEGEKTPGVLIGCKDARK